MPDFRQRIRQGWARLRANRNGAVATVVAIFMPVMLGVMALAVDVGSDRVIHSRMQMAADAAALAAVYDVASPPTAYTTAKNYVANNVPTNFGNVTTDSDITIGTYDSSTGFVPGIASSNNAIRVDGVRSATRGNPASHIFGAIWGTSDYTISVTAIAARPPNAFYEPPQSTNLDNEAGDFNELFAYCFDYEGTGPVDSRRSQMTVIANNLPVGAGKPTIETLAPGVTPVGSPEPYKTPDASPVWPDCRAKGLSLSLRLRNTRHAKSIPTLWANPNTSPKRPEYNYYTDTVIAGGKETFSTGTNSIIETVLCDTAPKCDNRSGSFVGKKDVKNRATPDRASDGCSPGKFMYFGFEDRPPGQPGASGSWTDPAWTDRDYNDIAIELKCPKSGKLGNAFARLVQ